MKDLVIIERHVLIEIRDSLIELLLDNQWRKDTSVKNDTYLINLEREIDEINKALERH